MNIGEVRNDYRDGGGHYNLQIQRFHLFSMVLTINTILVA